MSGAEQDNSSGAGSKYPGVRLRGAPKNPAEKVAEPAPSNPIIPPKEPNRPVVRVRRNPSSQPSVEELPPPPVSVPRMEESVPEETLPVAEDAFAREIAEEYSTEQAAQPCTETAQEYYGEPASQAYTETVQDYSAAAAAETCQASAVEPVEQAFSEPPDPAGATVPEVTSQSPAPPVSDKLKPVVRLRGRPKSAPAETSPASASLASSEMGGQMAPQLVESAATPGRLPYTPDTDQDRIYRRQWWKYDLRVKAHREPAPEEKRNP